MNSDDITRSMTNEADVDKDTQPTITAVFRLLREVKQDVANLGADLKQDVANLHAEVTNLSARIDATNTRLDATNTRLDGIELRVKEGFRGLSNKLDALNKSRLQADGDYIDLLDRVTELESKAS